jgi:hypothetical protein
MPIPLVADRAYVRAIRSQMLYPLSYGRAGRAERPGDDTASARGRAMDGAAGGWDSCVRPVRWEMDTNRGFA